MKLKVLERRFGDFYGRIEKSLSDWWILKLTRTYLYRRKFRRRNPRFSVWRYYIGFIIEIFVDRFRVLGGIEGRYFINVSKNEILIYV